MSADLLASAVAQRAALARGDIGVLELVRHQCERIAARDDASLNAVVVRDFDAATADAKISEQRYRAGTARPLEGVPVTVKESIHVRGLALTAGNPAYGPYVAGVDALAVSRLREAGAVIVGKTNVPLDMSDWQATNAIYGTTRNPWDPARTCGGSSGGAAAVAAGLSAIDLGSDIGGSVRIPAAFCGVYGHKPSETLLPRSGQLPVPPTPHWGAVLATFGPLARAPQDIELALQAMAGADVGESVAWRVQLPPARCERLRGARIAMLPLPRLAPVDPAIAAALERTCAALRAAGARVETAQPEGMGDWAAPFALYMRLLGWMMVSRLPAPERERRAQGMRDSGDAFQIAFAEGMACSGADLFGWHLQREGLRRAWREFFERWDVLVTPAFHTPAFEHRLQGGAALTTWWDQSVEVDGQVLPYTRGLFYASIATLPGQPALAVPAGQSAQGLPVGLQLVGPYLEDFTLTRVAALLADEIGGYVPPPAFAAA